MGDLIERGDKLIRERDVIEAIQGEEIWDPVRETGDFAYNAALKEAVCAVESLPSATTWTPASEVPEDDRDVLAQIEDRFPPMRRPGTRPVWFQAISRRDLIWPHVIQWTELPTTGGES